jgi:transposase-like protein
MDFAVLDLMDSDACYRFLVDTLHPDGLRCPACRRSDALSVHHRRHRPVLDDRCRRCESVFNAYTGTPLQKTRRSPAQLVLILRGVCQGTPTAQLARELRCDRKGLLVLRHKVQALALAAAQRAGPAAGPVAEADEMFQNAGEKEAWRTPTLTTLPGGGPVGGAATAPSTSTVRRWPGSSAGSPGTSGWRWSAGPTRRP